MDRPCRITSNEGLKSEVTIRAMGACLLLFFYFFSRLKLWALRDREVSLRITVNLCFLATRYRAIWNMP